MTLDGINVVFKVTCLKLRREIVKKLAVLFGLLLSATTFAHMSGETVAPLAKDASDAQKQAVRDGAQDFCDSAEEDEKEECVMDFFANHNLEEEPSCD